MIKLILFDIGGVLAADKNDEFLSHYQKITGLSIREFHKRVFGGAWHRFDKGKITKKQALTSIRKNIPHGKELPESFDEIGNMFFKRKQLLDYVAKLQEKHSVGVFSNMSAVLHKSMKQQNFPFSQFDYVFLSYQMKMRKPELQSYRYVCEKTGLHSSEILFIDDKYRNLLPAKFFGWKTLRYTNVKELKKKMKKYV